jgi:radical SAM protein with 4Fe4S-binding SPASM domain
MTDARYQLSSLVAFRRLGDFTLVSRAGSGRLMKLNPAGGRLLERLDAGEGCFTAQEGSFLEALAQRGIVVLEGGAGQTATRGDAIASEQAAHDLLGEVNGWAARRAIPLHGQLEVTSVCPLSCPHCYLDPRAADVPELSLEEITRFLGELAGLGGLFLTLTGGEPFSRPDLEEIHAAARARRFAVSLVTSGFGASRALLARMAARGLDAVQVSVHGPDAQSHDAFTGAPGSFDAALLCLRTARDLGVRVRASVTVTSRNTAALPVLKALLDREGLPAALGLYIEPRRDGDLGPQRLSADDEGVAQALALFPPASTPRMAALGPDDAPCNAGAGVLAMGPTGDLFPCLSFRRRVGSFRAAPLAQTWRASPILAELRALKVRDLDGCGSCDVRSRCDRCAGFALAEGLLATGHSPFDCRVARIV